jgi:osmotically-inducible protein OsmY
MSAKHLSALLGLLTLAGCTSLVATATGPEPLGRPAGERTLSMKIEDESIEHTASVNIYKADAQFHDANVNVVSFYGNVLLAGQVQSEALKARAEEVVRQIAEVKQIHNELTVQDASYLLQHLKDDFVSTRIRSSLALEKGFPSSRTKVLTVNGTVYLLGKLTSDEADQAVNIIKQVAGVQRIVKLVDYLPAATAATAPAGA